MLKKERDDYRQIATELDANASRLRAENEVLRAENALRVQELDRETELRRRADHFVVWLDDDCKQLEAENERLKAEKSDLFRAGFVANITVAGNEALGIKREWGFNGGPHTAEDLVSEAWAAYCAAQKDEALS